MRTYTRCFLDFSEYFTGKVFDYDFCLRKVYNPMKNMSKIKKNLKLNLPEFDFVSFYDDYWSLIEIFMDITFGYTKKVEYDKVINPKDWEIITPVKLKL